MQTLWKLTVCLCGIWAASLLYGEMITFWLPLSACSWPQLPKSSFQKNESIPHHVNTFKVAVLADTQLMDWTSLRLAPESFALKLAQFYTDLYMKRSFHSSILPFKPNVIIFLGDQFDGGPFLTDEEWQNSLNRFKHVFSLNQYGKAADMKVYYLSGNHDIGYAGLHSFHPEVIKRYEGGFGMRNYHFTAGKVNFIVVDSQTLDGPSEIKLTSTTWDFVKNVSADDAINPKVLLTHIPLYRPDDTGCGPHRNSPIINQRVSWGRNGQGIMYQNYLSEETSRRLLDAIKPILVVSGHDHDHCRVTHQTSFGRVTEYTLGTVSWQQGNFYPSFMLLSANARKFSGERTASEEAVSVQICSLPWQIYIYIWYLCLFVVTIILLLCWPTNGLRSWACSNNLAGFLERVIANIFQSAPKEKDDDDCEFEMIWDAEGTMHLVKKAAKKPVDQNLNISRPTARGNAIVRPTAKKYTDQEAGHSFSVDMNMEAKLGEGPGEVGLPRTSSKSWGRRIMQRLLRMFRLLTVLAAVNVPLYVMLLFKDWVEL